MLQSCVIWPAYNEPAAFPAFEEFTAAGETPGAPAAFPHCLPPPSQVLRSSLYDSYSIHSCIYTLC